MHLYDSVVTSPDVFTVLDLAIPAFLGAVPSFKNMLAKMDGSTAAHRLPRKRLQEAETALVAIPSNLDLWDWEGTAENKASLANAIHACEFPQFRVARATKLLHLKRPRLIPVFDSWTAEAWLPQGDSQRWTTEEAVDAIFRMGTELKLRLSMMADIESLAATLPPPFPSLTPLRLYDILFWMWMNSHREESSN